MQDAKSETQRACPSGAALTALASASCILHRVQGICGFGPDSAFGILHLHPASGAAHSFGADSAFCILHLHPASGAVHSFGADSAFCILHLHPVRGGNGNIRVRREVKRRFFVPLISR